MDLKETYVAAGDRYNTMSYNRVGNSGLKFPALSLGFWHNFGNISSYDRMREICRKAFDLGITQFDLANNYGPEYGAAERNAGRILKEDFSAYRDELVITSKAGYDMWPGPYGNWGSRKYLIASCDQSLKRLGLDYVDIFYHHRMDPETPLEETMGALKTLVDTGKALYAGISNYPADLAGRAAKLMRSWGTPLLICQSRYNLFNRTIEEQLLDTLAENGMGCIAFQPLSGGLLTDKYLHGIPADSRAGRDPRYLRPDMITEEKCALASALNDLALQRGETLAQMALQWVLRDGRVTSALIGASRPEQIAENMKALQFPPLTAEELARIDGILKPV